MRKLRPLAIGCITMLPPPIVASFLDHIEYWHEPFLLLSTAVAWPITSLIFDIDIELVDSVFVGLTFLGSAIWVVLLVLPLFVPRIQKAWFYLFQFLYSLGNAWYGIIMIATKHC